MKLWVILLAIVGVMSGRARLAAQVDSSQAPATGTEVPATEATDTGTFWVLRGNAEVKLNRKKQKLVYRLHVEPTRRIWASVTGSGIEGVRMLIRPDSFFILNRLSDEVLQGRVEVLAQQVGVSGGFPALVELLRGRARWVETQGTLQKSDRNEATYQLTDSSTYRNLVQLERTRQTLQQADLQRLRDGMEARLILTEFRESALGYIPFVLKFTTRNTESPLQAQLRHFRVEIPEHPPTFKFVIPAGFSRRSW